MSICDDCKYNHKNGDEQPCCSCLNWVDGYVDATNYEPID